MESAAVADPAARMHTLIVLGLHLKYAEEIFALASVMFGKILRAVVNEFVKCLGSL